MKYLQTKLIIQTVFVLIFFFCVQDAHAYSLTTQRTLQVNCISACPDEGMILQGYDGKITTNFTKKIYLRRSNGRDTGLAFDIEKGESVTLDEEDTTATWFETGAFYDSPPADGQWYKQLSGEKDGYYNEVYMVVSKPKDTKVAQISSLTPDIMSCNNTTKKCTALKAGTAFIMVDFPLGNQSSTDNWSGENKILGGYAYGYGLISYKIRKYSWVDINGNNKYDSGNTWENNSYVVKNAEVANTNDITIASYPYNFYPAMYMVTVTEAVNLPQTTTLNPVTSITQSGATINWAYSDPENDAQTNYQIVVATSSNFTTGIVKNITKTTTNVSSVRSYTISQGLSPNTLYYVRVRTYNETNGWSAYSSSRSFTTLTNPIPVPTNVSAVCSPDGNQITISWNDAVGYDAIYFRAEDRTTNPLTDTQLLWDNNLTANSKTINIIKGNLYEWWIHTKDTTNSNYSSAVGGQLTCTGGACPSDATLTGGACVCNDSSKEFNSSQNICLDRCSMNATWYNNSCNCNNGATDYPSCSTCPSGLQMVNGICTDPNSDTARVTTFDFSPDIAGTVSGTCPLILNVENTLGCRLVDRANQSQTIATTSPYIIDINTISKSVGTYKLYCTGTNNIESPVGSKSCYSNSEVKEN